MNKIPEKNIIDMTAEADRHIEEATRTLNRLLGFPEKTRSEAVGTVVRHIVSAATFVSVATVSELTKTNKEEV